jgi:hypothetical protein
MLLGQSLDEALTMPISNNCNAANSSVAEVDGTS